MNSFEDERNRQIIPRWLTFRETCLLTPPGVIDLSWMRRVISPNALDFKRQEWIQSHLTPYAIDLMCSAHVVGATNDPIVREAAAHLLQQKESLPTTIVEVASSLLENRDIRYQIGKLSIETIQSRIRSLRQIANGGCRDPFAFIDLAFFYVLLAQNEKASRCAQIALALAPQNPLILRAVARFYLHADKAPDRSVRILRNSPVTKMNPLLLSADIAISEAFGLKSPLRKIGRKVVFEGDFHPWILAELAGTIGTMELNSFSSSKAKKCFRIAAKCPDENTFAKLQWVSQRINVLETIEDECRPNATFEAEAIAYYHAERFDEALNSAINWARFQPFTSRSAVFASFVSSDGLEDYASAISVLEHALIASPNSFTLKNNLAFAFASSSRVEDALKVMREVDVSALSRKEAAVAKATNGLITFRLGEQEHGRNLYAAAASEFRKIGDTYRAALAEVYWAREELEARTNESKEMVKKALAGVEKCGIKGLKVIERLRNAQESI